MSNYNLDNPISHENEDCFERHNFAKRISSICSNNSSKATVVGIYGKWGEGKTSLLNLVSKSLPNDIVQIKFNPWYFNNQEQLVTEFFKSIAAGLGRDINLNKKELNKLIASYGESIGIAEMIPNASPFITLSKLFLSLFKSRKTVKSEDFKNRIDDFIIDADRNIVIFIDDIDRLDVKEVELIFKLVKLLADFPRTTYLLSFDVELVAKMIAPHYGGIIPHSGHQFLEKIIQLPLVLPKARHKALRNYVKNILEKSLDKDTMSQKRFEDAFTSGLIYLLSTPRKAIRFSNTIHFSIPLLKGEVDTSDLVIIEAIKASLPEYYLFIRENSELFLTDYWDEKTERHEGKKEPALNKINAIISTYPDYIRQSIHNLTCLLFPRFVWAESHEARSVNMEKALLLKRICSPSYFERYFSYSLQSDEISDTHLEKYYLNAENFLVDDLVKQYSEDFIKYSADDVIFKLVYYRKYIKGKSAENLAIAISILSNNYGAKEAFNFGTSFTWAAMTVQALIEALPSHEALKVAEEIIQKSGSVPFAAEMVARFTMPISETDTYTVFTGADATRIKEVYINRVKRLIDTSGFFDALPEDNMIRLLVWWNDTNKSELTDLIRKELDINRKAPLKLLRIFTPTIHSIGSNYEATKTFKSGFGEEHYKRIDSIIGASLLYEKLTKEYGDKSELPSVETVGHRDEIDDVTLVGLFQKYYRSSTL